MNGSKLPATLTECTAAVAATVTTAVVATEVTTRSVFFWTCKADVDSATVKVFAIKLVNSFLVVVFVDVFYETEAFRTTAVAISDYSSAFYFADLLEMSF